MTGVRRGVNGNDYTIGTLSGTDQWVEVGECSPSSQNGGCDGECHQKTMKVTLLAKGSDEDDPTFQLFEVNAYCSCQAN
nr:hypothetical protein BaRGS_021202 [Batillaria attramentaria]